MRDLSRIRLTEREFAALAAGGGDPEIVARLRSANRNRTLLAVAFIATETARGGHRDAAVVARAYRVLADAHAAAPGAVWRVLDEPEVVLWAMGAARELVHGGDRCPPALLANVAAAAAVRAGVPADLTTTEAPLSLPSLGTVTVGARQVRLRQDGDGTLVRAGGPAVRIPGDVHARATGWSPLTTARFGPSTVTLDQWRLTAPPAPFDTELTRSPDERSWSRVLTAAADLLARHGVAEPILAGVRTITPLRGSRARPAGATLSDAFGCVLLSLPRGARAAGLALVHEFQHAKLTVVTDLFPLLEPGAGQRLYVPWRTDPRPLLGSLHGAYAFVGVVGFWARQRLLDTESAAVREAEVEFARWLAATRETVEALAARPELTAYGRTFVAGMGDTLAGWSAETVSPAARAEADHQRLAHRDRWSSTG
ncbi:aKG-HExxH-type peptide beta-hydroxylase [Actinophytocola sediminis]